MLQENLSQGSYLALIKVDSLQSHAGPVGGSAESSCCQSLTPSGQAKRKSTVLREQLRGVDKSGFSKEFKHCWVKQVIFTFP